MLLLLPAFAIVPVKAQQHEPDLHWRTLSTSHFDVQYPVGFEKIAGRVALLCEDVYQPVSQSLHYFPPRTQVVIHVRSDISNGMVSPLPWRMELDITEPQGDWIGSRDNWLRVLITHEFTHVVHLRKKSGFSAFTAPFFGELNSFWQGITPHWFIEGFPTLNETRFTHGGRGRNAYHWMEMVTPVLAHKPWKLASTNYISRKKLPVGMYYVSGYYLANYINRKYGSQVWADILDRYTSAPVWGFNRAMKKITGKTQNQLYREMIAEIDSFTAAGGSNRFAPVIWSRGKKKLPEKEYLLHRIPRNDASPRWRDDEHILTYRTGFDDLPAVVEIDRQGAAREILSRALTNQTNSYSVGKRYLVWTELKPHPRFSATIYSDVFYMLLNRGKIRRLTRNQRIFGVDISPDESKIIAVQNHLLETELVSIRLADGKIDSLLEMANSVILNPRWSPDGKYAAFALKDTTGWQDIALLNTETGKWRSLYPKDEYHDNNPCWGTDGKTIFFSSDRSGIFNIWAVDVATGKRWQVTDTATGAFSPDVSPDGDEIVFSLYTYSGFVAATIPLHRSAWIAEDSVHTVSLPARLQPSAGERVDLPRREFSSRKVRSYKPYGQILRPQGWTPMVFKMEDEYQPGLVVLSEDALHRHSWQGILGWFRQTRQPFYNFFYNYSRFWPNFSFGLYDSPRKITYQNFTGWWRRYGVNLTFSLPLTLESNVYSTYFTPFFSLNLENQKHAVGILFPRYHRYRGLRTGFQFVRGNKTFRDVVPHKLFSLAANFDWTSPKLKSNYAGQQFTGRMNLFFPTFIKHHQIQLYTSYQARRGNYGYGYSGSLPVGYDDDNFSQQFRFKTGYHFPIIFLDLPLPLLPVHFDYLAGALFYDWGTSWDYGIGRERWQERGRYSAGFQLTLTSFSFQFAPVDAGIAVFYRSAYRDFSYEYTVSLQF